MFQLLQVLEKGGELLLLLIRLHVTILQDVGESLHVHQEILVRD